MTYLITYSQQIPTNEQPKCRHKDFNQLKATATSSPSVTIILETLNYSAENTIISTTIEPLNCHHTKRPKSHMNYLNKRLQSHRLSYLPMINFHFYNIKLVLEIFLVSPFFFFFLFFVNLQSGCLCQVKTKLAFQFISY